MVRASSPCEDSVPACPLGYEGPHSYPHSQSSPEKANSRLKFSILSRTLTIRHRSLPPFFGPLRPLPIIWSRNGSPLRCQRVSPISSMTEVKVGAMERWASSKTTRLKSDRNPYSPGCFDSFDLSVWIVATMT